MPLLVLFACFLATLFLSPAAAHPAGFRPTAMADGTEVGIWYPATGTPQPRRFGLYAADVVMDGAIVAGRHPLVVISHGTGGDYAGHVDTAVALAQAGFVVAALTHPGDNWRDTSRATRIEERPRALIALIDHMLAAAPFHDAIDPRRIGAFGFSAGGFTVLTAAGAVPDLSRSAAYCAAHPTTFVCQLLASYPRTASPWAPVRDPRIRALVVAAPALGYSFDRAGLAAVRVPVQLWRADDDRILPADASSDAVARLLPRRAERHTVPAAGHFDFLSPCADATIRPDLCASAPGFDRAAFHTRFNSAVVAFFQRTLRS